LTIKNLFSALRYVPWSSKYGGRKLLCGRKAAAAPSFMQTAIILVDSQLHFQPAIQPSMTSL
jgi:hypothetical protein